MYPDRLIHCEELNLLLLSPDVGLLLLLRRLDRMFDVILVFLGVLDVGSTFALFVFVGVGSAFCIPAFNLT